MEHFAQSYYDAHNLFILQASFTELWLINCLTLEPNLGMGLKITIFDCTFTFWTQKRFRSRYFKIAINGEDDVVDDKILSPTNDFSKCIVTLSINIFELHVYIKHKTCMLRNIHSNKYLMIGKSTFGFLTSFFYLHNSKIE